MIHNVGPGGNFLAEAMTATEARKQWKSSCIKGMTFEELQAADMPELGQRLLARAKDIIAKGPQPQKPLYADILKALDEVVKRTANDLTQSKTWDYLSSFFLLGSFFILERSASCL